jgi:hypothetical protein
LTLSLKGRSPYRGFQAKSAFSYSTSVASLQDPTSDRLPQYCCHSTCVCPIFVTCASSEMSAHQSQRYAVVRPRKDIPSSIGLPPLRAPSPPFGFLDLPAEIRTTIYNLWIPSVLHVSLGLRGIRLLHFADTSESFSFQAVSIRPFFLNRQFYHEFCHALFTRSTWCFSSAKLLAKALPRLPTPTRDRIRHVSMRLFDPDDTSAGCESKDPLTPIGFYYAQRLLRKMKQLQTLVININLAEFSSRDSWSSSTRNLAHKTNTAYTLAAHCVADFAWEGLRTRIPFAESDLSTRFTDVLSKRCGWANVSVVRRHKDRYAGQLVDVVISQCAVLDGVAGDGIETGSGGSVT